jgi:hypothetical protein
MRGKNIKWLSLVALLLVNIFVITAASPVATKMYVNPSNIWSPTTLPEDPIILKPNGDATPKQWSIYPSTPTTHYDKVDEASQNGDTDYVYTTLSGRTESSQLENVASPPSWQPASVRVVVYARANTTTGAYLFLTIALAGNRDYSVDFINLTTSFEMYYWDWGKNPWTNVPWTWSDINALEAGERSYIQSGVKAEIRVTQLYVEVTGPRVEFNVDVQDVVDLYGWGFKLLFNPSIVEVTAVIEGPFLKPSPTQWMVSINNAAGYALVGDTLIPPYPAHGVSGSGTLATVILKVVGKGVTPLDLTETKLNTVIADNKVPIEHMAVDGQFDNRYFNLPPYADLKVTPPIGTVGTAFTFDASGSSDDGWIVSYFWDFGDGTTATGKVIHKTWGSGTEGTYIVTLNVTDNDGASTIAHYSLVVYAWMMAGDHPDLVNTLIWPEYPVFKEADFGEHETLWAKVGNPTDKSWTVRVDFEIFSKDEARKLGTISTGNATIGPYEKKDIPADFFLADPRWATTTGPYNWPYWVKKYWAIGRCFYINETTGQWNAGIFPGANQFKIHPVTHDRAITALTANPTTAHVGDTVVISVTIENQGEQIEDIQLKLSVVVPELIQIGTVTATLAIGENQTVTFNWIVPATLPSGDPLEPCNIVFKAEISSHPYERDISDQTSYIVIAIVE